MLAKSFWLPQTVRLGVLRLQAAPVVLFLPVGVLYSHLHFQKHFSRMENLLVTWLARGKVTFATAGKMQRFS